MKYRRVVSFAVTLIALLLLSSCTVVEVRYKDGTLNPDTAYTHSLRRDLQSNMIDCGYISYATVRVYEVTSGGSRIQEEQAAGCYIHRIHAVESDSRAHCVFVGPDNIAPYGKCEYGYSQ